jgi:nucleoside-diphosphate kinase
MLKPDAIDKNLAYKVLTYFTNCGIKIEALDIQQATEAKIRNHYGEHFAKYGEEFARKMLDQFLNKTVVPVVLSGDGDVIAEVRHIVGATEPAKAEKGTIRGDFGDDDSYAKSTAENRVVRNIIHASDSPETVKREIAIWLPEYIIK